MIYYQTIYANLNKEQTKERYQQIQADFEESFGYSPKEFFSSPGRCELVGNHTDHNNGKVLVASINKDIIACASPTNNGIITVKSDFGLDEIYIDDLAVKEDSQGTTASLIRGVADYCNQNGFIVGGFDCVTNSKVPSGSGLSSSASFEVLICQIISTLYNGDSITPLQKAFCAHYAETEHFGKPCGLLDQCGVAFGGICYIDFYDTYSPIVKGCQAEIDKRMVMIKTTEDHAALTSHYTAIKDEMCQVAEHFGKRVLRQVDEEEFNKLFETAPHNRALSRAKHFFDENKRVEATFCALQNKDYNAFYSLINQSGISSRFLLQNCAIEDEQDSPICFILDELKKIDNCGAYRVHGGGFRGSVLAFLDNNITDEILESYFGEQNVIDVAFRQVGTCKIDMEELWK